MASAETEELDWLAYFARFFWQAAAPLAEVLDADGCREGWLQGELFRYGRRHGPKLSTNASVGSRRRKFDLLCKCPPMVAEIKICGGSYQTKNRGMIRDDVEKLLRAGDCFAKILVLVVDRRVTDTKLADWLATWNPPDPPGHRRALQRDVSDRVTVRMWEL